MKLSTIFSVLAFAGPSLVSFAQTSPKVMPKSAVPKPEALRLIPQVSSTRVLALGRADLSSNFYREILDVRLGSVQKRMKLFGGNPCPVLRCQRPVCRLAEEEQPTLLYEDFESWDGETSAWLPDGWSKQCTNDEQAAMADGRFTWHVDTKRPQQTIPSAVEGSKFAIVYYANTTDENGKKVDLAQDEWLISPTVRLGEDARLSFYLGYSPLFLFDLNNENVNWGAMDFVSRKPSTTLKVMLRADGGEWQEIYDVYNEWAEEPFSSLFNSCFDSSYHPVSLSLADYAGKQVQVAFRFVGKFGNTMEIDAVRISGHSGDVAVRPLAEDTGASVSLQDGHLTVSGYEGCVRVYDEAGRRLSATQSQGKAVIPVQGFPDGVWMVRLDDGRVFKLMKGCK